MDQPHSRQVSTSSPSIPRIIGPHQRARREPVPGLTNGKVSCNWVVMPRPSRIQIFSPFSCLPNIFPICQA